ncbi:hypothetical protein [uncultured Tenacibaculum sp.]|uniref:hypothetical protein n=1 Tax=uncultured Tenacibaculum sp. TaxID=174713 RepID=UPI00260E8D7A|nr:hypothetical protein [uncultured Tenacibaculum sp.]
MKLTDTQIQEIDILLKKGGIKYWDLRIEMVDHIVSDIEHNATTNDFQFEFETSLKKAGWYKKLNSIHTSGWKKTNDIYRKKYFKGILQFFTNPINLIIFSIAFCCYFYLSTQLPYSTFSKINFALFFVPIIIFFTYSIIIWRKKLGNSVNVSYGIFYFGLAFMILQSVPNFIKDLSTDSQTLIWLILLPLYSVASYSGYKLCKESVEKIEKFKKLLA